MKKHWLLVIALALFPAQLAAQDKPLIVVQPFTSAKDVTLPYDLKQLQAQLVAEFKVELGKTFDIAAEAPAQAPARMYTLSGEIVGWRAGNAAKRLLVGMGSGREATDIQYAVTDSAGKKVVDKKDTVRTNFFNNSGSTGTLAHPIAEKIAERIKDAKLK